jgi:hypothetical protein
MFVSDSDFQRADWPLLQNGAVNLFLKSEILADARQALSALDYEIAEVSCAGPASNFEAQMSLVLRWRENFGYEQWRGNLNALDDGFGCYPFGASSRSALVLTGFHHLVAADGRRAHSILDIIENWSRNHLLRSKCLIALVQTDDPTYESDGLGCRWANWNIRERFYVDRGLPGEHP